MGRPVGLRNVALLAAVGCSCGPQSSDPTTFGKVGLDEIKPCDANAAQGWLNASGLQQHLQIGRIQREPSGKLIVHMQVNAKQHGWYTSFAGLNYELNANANVDLPTLLTMKLGLATCTSPENVVVRVSPKDGECVAEVSWDELTGAARVGPPQANCTDATAPGEHLAVDTITLQAPEDRTVAGAFSLDDLYSFMVAHYARVSSAQVLRRQADHWIELKVRGLRGHIIPRHSYKEIYIPTFFLVAAQKGQTVETRIFAMTEGLYAARAAGDSESEYQNISSSEYAGDLRNYTLAMMEALVNYLKARANETK